MAFKKVDSKVDLVKLEHKIIDFWTRKDILSKYLRKNDSSSEIFSFLDGPITANNPMGVHHAWGRTYKDLWQRYNSMKGKKQKYQNGFDCQGLWVEVEVEKELGFKTKKDIEDYGIDRFVNKCKERVYKYSKIQTEQSKRLGYFADWENSYYTMSDENNYMIWFFLKKCHEKGYLYKGHDVVPWCLRCGTAISQHEILTEEYKEMIHQSVYVKLPIKNRKGEFFLVWTTTPWTLTSNIALAINPEFTYVKIKTGKEIYYLSKETLSIIEDEYDILEEIKGDKLLDIEYEGPFDELEVQRGVLHKTIFWEEVGEEEGTGIVHIAPGCGEEDFRLSVEHSLKVIAPLDDAGNYISGFGELSGKNVKDVTEAIFENLKKKNKIFRIYNYTHRYPTCWRCKEELIFRLVDEWYIGMDKKDPEDKEKRTLREQMIDIAKKIKWIPLFGLDRELDWLSNMHNWLISKKRYWGLALPIYECDCGNFEVIGSKEELKEKAVSGWDKFERNTPHRPWIDEVKIKCSKCKKEISRITDVGNPWLDAGIVPYSTIAKSNQGEPLYKQDKKEWMKWVPVDFITESFPGQFKNWFYALIAMSTVMEGIKPYKTVLGYASVRDEKGEEMHKSKGNAIWFDDAAEEIGVDVMRWMYARHNPVFNLSFGYHAASDIRRKILTLWNVYSFFSTYVSIDNWDPDIESQEIEKDSVLDKWIISELHLLLEYAEKELDNFRVHTLMERLEKFIDDLSTWYVRRSRRRFWKSEDDQDKKQAYETLYEVLVNLSKVLAPIIPHFSEEIYQNLVSGRKGEPESVHLSKWPKADPGKIDKKISEEINNVREVVNQGLSQRAEKGIKVRQPLAKALIESTSEIQNEFLSLIREELNVKDIVVKEGKETKVELDTKITPKLEKEGLARELVRTIQSMRKKAEFNVEDRIIIYYSTDSNLLKDTIKEHSTGVYNIGKETLGEEIIEGREKVDFDSEFSISQEKIWIGIEKIKK